MDGELFRIALKNVAYRRLRSFLTLLGVAIGIAAVVALISLGQGLSATVTEQLKQLGPDKIAVVPSGLGQGGLGSATASFSKSLVMKDVDMIEKIKGVKKALPMISKRMVAEYGQESSIVWVSGIPPEESEDFFKNVQGWDLESGRWMKKGEDNTVVVGHLVPDLIFPKLRLRNKVEIEGQKFRVIGIMKSVGNTQDDTSFIISLEAMQKLLNNTKDVTVIMVQASGDPNEVADRIEKELDDKYGENVFMAMTTEQIIERVNTVFAALSAVLAGIAAISLVVAGFGIMNTMLMSVMERTREIGIMKAIGATNFRVLSLFLTESAIVGIAGGVVGVVFGGVTTALLSGIISQTIGFEFNAYVSPLLLVGVIAFSAVVGSLSGLYPAWRASRLNPVEALRYE